MNHDRAPREMYQRNALPPSNAAYIIGTPVSDTDILFQLNEAEWRI